MQWPPWSNGGSDDRPKGRKSSEKTPPFNGPGDTLWIKYTAGSTLLLTSSILLAVRFYSKHLRRIPQATYIMPSVFRKRSLFGRVTRVGDADNFHMFHTPGGKWTGWGWFPGRKIPDKKDLKNQTIHVRLAGVDAPEMAHFGNPAQPYSAEAYAWLKDYISDRKVRAYVYKRDQYERVVATVFVRRFWLRRDVGKEMLKAGMATVYEAKTGAEFGDLEEAYRAAEAKAKRKNLGMWSLNKQAYESPREYKKRIKAGEGIGS